MQVADWWQAIGIREETKLYPVSVESAYRTDIGGRDEQQDRVAAFSTPKARLFVLADGVGGEKGGALAAQMVLDTARNRFAAECCSDPLELLASIATISHNQIKAMSDESTLAPQSTCVFLYVDQTTTAWGHVGDSRLYRFERGRLAERTVDHSVTEVMRLQGRITEEEMATHPSRNRLFAALGTEREPPIDVNQCATRDCDSFLLASDGLWGNVSQTEMEDTVAAPDLVSALLRLIERAKRRGGSRCDNLSGVAVRWRTLEESA